MCITTKGMLFIFRFPLLLQLLLLQRFSGLIAQQCDSEESIVGMMLQRHIFKIMKPSSSLHCLQACNGNVRCQSFNYDFSDGICELNNHTKEDKPEDFIPNFTRYYFGKARKRAPLGSIPELAAESCQEIKASRGQQVVSDRYWIHSAIQGKAILAYCDMETGDIDECESGLHDCLKNLSECVNTIGSYNCVCNSGYQGDGKTNCISITYADQCYDYHNLSDADRKSSYVTPTSGPVFCDDTLLDGWYRFVGDAGTKMPTTRVPAFRCGTDWSGWLNGAHPTVGDGKVIRKVCFSNRDTGCRSMTYIFVTNCGSFYIYKPSQPPVCDSRYCGTD